MHSDHIIIRGARQHNLKNIDVRLPRNQLIVFTGLSGSGKSTLAFDTIYAEGQRRYVESLSAYARQFLERMEKPEADLIEGLSPAISIEQKTAGHNPRSTVGTVTEIYDYLRLLFARVGTPVCHQCGLAVVSQALDPFVDRVLDLPPGTRILILAPVDGSGPGSRARLFRRLKKEGFARVRLDGEVFSLEDLPASDHSDYHNVEVVVDRLIIKESLRNRLVDSLELAISFSEGRAAILANDTDLMVFSEFARCPGCGLSYPEFTPASFSFNSPQGACSACNGLGATTEFDPSRIVPNPKLSLREGAVAPWANRNSVHFIELLESLTNRYGGDIYTPFKDLPERLKQVLLYGSGEEEISFFFEKGNRRYSYRKTYEGIIQKLQRRYMDTESSQSMEEIKRYMNFIPCKACKGTRLNPASRSVLLGPYNISRITSMSVDRISHFFQTFKLEGQSGTIADRILKEIRERLRFLSDVGLSYLTLDRSAGTLSGGESQRIRLATQIGSKLTGVLYVLDEPSIGLHQRDNRRLLETLFQMRDLGNTVIVVEHDEETVRAADYVLDMGPGGGVNGGRVVFSGKPDELLLDRNSLTAQYLSGRKSIPVPRRRRPVTKSLIVEGASENNLQDLDVAFPLGCLVCVTGVSGSGKSTLVLETLYRALSRELNHLPIVAGTHRRVTGAERVDKVINIDQAPIGRTPRSNPATYTGVFFHIRDLFSRTPESRMRGYKPGRFSFNVRGGGRCEACAGDGIIKIEMHFLPDVYVPCDVCRGRRYNRETLEVRYKGKNITEVLDMTINQSLSFFQRHRAIRTKLQTLADVGIGYVRLGQPATTLSGGEAQRIKLAKELSKKGTGKTVYILDEPTTGLHADDIHKLLDVLNRLVDSGNTVIVIEHHLDVIKTADYVIDLGPEGGDKGGTLVACGTPEAISRVEASHTGRYLRKVLDRG